MKVPSVNAPSFNDIESAPTMAASKSLASLMGSKEFFAPTPELLQQMEPAAQSQSVPSSRASEHNRRVSFNGMPAAKPAPVRRMSREKLKPRCLHVTAGCRVLNRSSELSQRVARF